MKPKPVRPCSVSLPPAAWQALDKAAERRRRQLKKPRANRSAVVQGLVEFLPLLEARWRMGRR